MILHVDDVPEYMLRNVANWNREQASNMRSRLNSPHEFIRIEAERNLKRYEANALELESMID